MVEVVMASWPTFPPGFDPEGHQNFSLVLEICVDGLCGLELLLGLEHPFLGPLWPDKYPEIGVSWIGLFINPPKKLKSQDGS